ncbi:MAG: hypothetical protein Q4G42_08505 [Neisseria sp.]|nr:hypothetical protein [Neisseria sp.]
MNAVIEDYLSTQGLRVPVAQVREAVQVLGLVLQHAEVQLADEALWRAPARQDGFQAAQVFDLHGEIPDDVARRQLLRRVYAAAETAFAQHTCSHLSVFLLQPERLLRLVSCGRIAEGELPCGADDWDKHLAVRCAQSAWLNVVEDSAEWLRSGDLTGERHLPPMRQWALPICRENGAVLGVLYGEGELTLPVSDELLGWWVGFAIALVNVMDKFNDCTDDALCP